MHIQLAECLGFTKVMFNLWRSTLVLMTVFGVHGSTAQWSTDVESTLQQTLLTNYSKNVRPTETVQVRIGMTVNNIIEMDIVDQHMLLSGSLIVSWQDNRLKWNSSQYPTSDTFFNKDQIWRPLVVLINSADDINVLGDEGNSRSIPLQVFSYGFVIWLPPAFFKSLCPADIALFPFDTQKCEILISSWMYPNSKINFSLANDNVFTNRYEENGEYHLVRTYSELRNVQVYGNYPWSIAVFGYELQRRYSYYMINIVMPVFFLEALGVVVFLVPASSGEKLAYALTLLLSLIVMTTIVAEKIPTTSIQTPVLGVYVLEGVILAVFEVLLAVYVLQLHKWDEEKRTPGKRHVILMSVFTKFSCGSRNKVSVVHPGDTDNQISGTEKISTVVGPATDSDKVTITEWESNEPLTYRDIAASVEKFCCWCFTMLTIFFILQMVFTVVCG